MSKQAKTLLVFLFSMLIMDLTGNNLYTQANKVSSATRTDTIVPGSYSPRDVGMNPATLDGIGSIVKIGMEAKAFPGCQVLVMKNGKLVYDKCFGYYTYEQTQEVTPTTMYDLASLSKTTGTLLAIMKLYDEGKLQLSYKASAYLPFLRGTDKENITIKDLLFHESGLPASLSCDWLIIEKKACCPDSTKDTTQTVQIKSTIYQYKEGWTSKTLSEEYNLQVSDSFYLHSRFHDAAMQKILDTRLRSKTYVYSCVNFILLKEIAESISGIPMDVFLDSLFYAPMGLKNTAYLPLRTHSKEEIAPTLKRDFLRNGLIQGYVHDPDAAFLGGISGNAGLFASAGDVAKVYQMLLNHGELEGKRYLSTETCRVFTTTTSASGRRGLGFDKPVPSNPAHSPCCLSAPGEVYGHTGYTGTCCWVDPVNNLVYVFLSNRTYPNDRVNKLARMGIRTKIQEVIYQSIMKKND
ncbi:MAG: serine hydrolase [Bacteroidales bacterium]|nr:serine hydrolase [Bacteroidales bacterium]